MAVPGWSVGPGGQFVLPRRFCMLSEALVTNVLAHAMRGGATFAEVYVERWRRRALRVLDGDVKEATSGLEFGAGIRLFFGVDVAYAYTNDLTPQSLLDVTGPLLQARGNAGRVDERGRGGLDFREHMAVGLHAPGGPFETRPQRH